MKDFSIGYRRCRFFYKKRNFKRLKIDLKGFFWYQLVVGHHYFVFEIRSKERYRKQLPWTEPDGPLRGPLKFKTFAWTPDKGWKEQ